MRFAYADPPYLGLAVKLYSDQHPEAAVYDTVEGHSRLIERLCDEFPDGWAMSLHTPSLRTILPLCPSDVRTMAWVKPFCSFKPNVRVAYAWEPIIVRGGRPFKGREQDTVRDWCAVNMAMKKGFPTAKPAGLVRWLLSVLNAQRSDEIIDLFPGSGSVGMAINEWCELGAPMSQGTLWDEMWKQPFDKPELLAND